MHLSLLLHMCFALTLLGLAGLVSCTTARPLHFPVLDYAKSQQAHLEFGRACSAVHKQVRMGEGAPGNVL